MIRYIVKRETAQNKFIEINSLWHVVDYVNMVLNILVIGNKIKYLLNTVC